MGKRYYDTVVKCKGTYEEEIDQFKEWFDGVFYEVKPNVFRGYLNEKHKKSLDLFRAVAPCGHLYEVLYLDIENPKDSDILSGDWWKSYERRKREALA